MNNQKASIGDATRSDNTSNATFSFISLKDLPKVPLKKVIQCYHEAEYGDARLFSLLFKGRCVYDHTSKKWFSWQGHYWIEDKEHYIYNLVSGHLASCYITASAELNVAIQSAEPSSDAIDIDILSALSEEEEKEGNKKAKQKALIKSLQGRAFALRAITRAKQVLEYATSKEFCLSVTADVWDINPWLLGTRDGVIDLRKGTIRNGNPSDYIRTVIPAKWQGLDAQCPRFERYLDEVFSDRDATTKAELIEFLQRMLGYGTTGKVSERLFLVLYGLNGHNGKDTLMTAIKNTLGGVVGAISNDVIIAPPKGANPGQAKPHLVGLQGKRVAWASEPDKGERFNVGQVKYLTGGDVEIVARALYEGERTFSPTFLLILLTNHKPHADASDNAFWGRICPIVYNLSYVDNPVQEHERKKDTTLNEALSAESSGILAWLVRGCLKWQAAGMAIPKSVLAARQDYRKGEDTLGQFIEQTCNTLSAEHKVPASDLFKAYQEWIVANGLGKGMSGPAFGTEIKQRFKAKHTKTGNMYYGIGLQTIYPLPEVQEPVEEVTPEPTPKPTKQTSDNGYWPTDDDCPAEESYNYQEPVRARPTSKPEPKRTHQTELPPENKLFCYICKQTERVMVHMEWVCRNPACSKFEERAA